MNRRRFVTWSCLILIIMSFTPLSLLAHTGVTGMSGFNAGFSHPFTGLDHMLAMIAVGLWAAQTGGKAQWMVPGAFVAVMVAGGVIGISDLSIPYAEQGILLSILVLGLLIAMALKLPLLVSAVVVAIFALFHGYAHGTEMPSLSGGVTYSLGFALATMLLHIVGIGLGTGLQSLKAGRLIRGVGAVIAGAGIYLAVA